MKSNQSKRKPTNTFVSLASLYCPWGQTGNRKVGKRQSIRAFWQELHTARKGEVPLAVLLKRMGWYRGRRLTAAMRKVIEKRLGEPE